MIELIDWVLAASLFLVIALSIGFGLLYRVMRLIRVINESFKDGVLTQAEYNAIMIEIASIKTFILGIRIKKA
jgi:hypothetical protein